MSILYASLEHGKARDLKPKDSGSHEHQGGGTSLLNKQLDTATFGYEKISIKIRACLSCLQLAATNFQDKN